MGAGGSVSRTRFEPEPGWRARSGDVGDVEQPMRPKAAAAARTAMTTREDFMREPHEVLRGGVVRDLSRKAPGVTPHLRQVRCRTPPHVAVANCTWVLCTKLHGSNQLEKDPQRAPPP